MPPLRTLIASLFGLTALVASELPVKPEMRLEWGLDKDPGLWELQQMQGNKTAVVFGFVPAGETLKNWNEMVEHTIGFTKGSVRELVDLFVAGMKREDPKIDLAEEVRNDGSIIITYTSLGGNEAGMRRFVKGPDGVYMISYNVRPARKTEARWQKWREIISSVKLVPFGQTPNTSPSKADSRPIKAADRGADR